MLDINKALDTTSGVKLIPEKIDPELIDIALKETPLLKIFKELPWSAASYQWNERSAIVGSGAYDEDDTFSAANSTYGRKSVDMKMIKGDGGVSNLLIETSKDFINALAAEVESTTQGLAQELERLYIDGNISLNPKEFDGLSNLVSQTYDAACSSISLDILDASINAVKDNGGVPELIVLANRDLQELHKIMRAAMVYNWEKVEVAAGVYLTHYRGVPLYGSSFIPTTLGPSAEESYGFILQLSRILVPVLKNITYEDMTAKVNTDSKAFRVKTWRTLSVKGASKFHNKIVNLAKPS